MQFSRKHWLSSLLGLALCLAAQAQTDRAPALLPLADEAAPKLVVYPPLPAPLARGVVILQFRTENLRVMPVFGATAVALSPRVGHVHVTVDDWHGTWAHTSGDPVIVTGLAPGQHSILLELADPNHMILTGEKVMVTVPEVPGQPNPPNPHSH